MPVCNECEAVNENGARFCYSCGSVIEVTKIYCPECGTEASVGSKFCHGCGFNLSNLQSPAPGSSSRKSESSNLSATGTEILGQFEDGDIIGQRYRVIRKLGQGGFAATYLVEHVHLNEIVVLKELLHSSKKGRELFDREARVMRSLRVKGVPDVTDYFDEGNRSYIVQSYIEGETLEQKLKHGKLSEPEGRNLLLSVLHILKELHQKEIIHRDIKPDNLIIDQDKNYNLIDFGAVKIASVMDDEGKSKTNIGTPGYSPLEQMNGRTVKASDIYALGMTVSEAITGVSARDLRKTEVEDIDYSAYGIHDRTLKDTLLKMTEMLTSRRFSEAVEIIARFETAPAEQNTELYFEDKEKTVLDTSAPADSTTADASAVNSDSDLAKNPTRLTNRIKTYAARYPRNFFSLTAGALLMPLLIYSLLLWLI